MNPFSTIHPPSKEELILCGSILFCILGYQHLKKKVIQPMKAKWNIAQMEEKKIELFDKIKNEDIIPGLTCENALARYFRSHQWEVDRKHKCGSYVCSGIERKNRAGKITLIYFGDLETQTYSLAHILYYGKERRGKGRDIFIQNFKKYVEQYPAPEQ